MRAHATMGTEKADDAGVSPVTRDRHHQEVSDDEDFELTKEFENTASGAEQRTADDKTKDIFYKEKHASGNADKERVYVLDSSKDSDHVNIRRLENWRMADQKRYLSSLGYGY